MARRKPDPLNLYIAHRTGLFQRLIAGGRMSEQVAELGISAFEAHSRELHLDSRSADFWRPAWDWIAEQHSGLKGVR
jgi:hypothetical protein